MVPAVRPLQSPRVRLIWYPEALSPFSLCLSLLPPGTRSCCQVGYPALSSQAALKLQDSMRPDIAFPLQRSPAVMALLQTPCWQLALMGARLMPLNPELPALWIVTMTTTGVRTGMLQQMPRHFFNLWTFSSFSRQWCSEWLCLLFI